MTPYEWFMFVVCGTLCGLVVFVMVGWNPNE